MHDCKHDGEIKMIITEMRVNRAEVNKRFDKIDAKLDNVVSWKYKIIGGVALAIFVAPFIYKWLTE